MKKFIFGLLSLSLMSLVVAAALYGVYKLFAGMFIFFGSVDANIAVAAITASSAVVVSTLTIVLGKQRETSAARQKEAREKKIPVYEECISFMVRALMSSKTGSPPTEREVLEFFSKFTQRLSVWGADDVVRAWVRFRQAPSDGSHEQLFRYEDVVRAIRKDLGHRNSNLTKGVILGLFINDIQEVLDDASK